jgi:predicted ATPase
MGICEVEANNFKSFKQIHLNLKKFNVLIGANAAGKSNFIQLFKFFRDLERHGINNAISMQGGIEYLPNMKLNDNTVSFKFVTDGVKYKRFQVKDNYQTEISMTYSFSLSLMRETSTFKIEHDEAKYHYKLYKMDKTSDGEKETFLEEGYSVVASQNGKLIYDDSHLPKKIQDVTGVDFLRDLFKTKTISSESLFIETPFVTFMMPFSWGPYTNILSDIGVYDFDPKLPKKSVSLTGRTELESDGNNLAIVLRKITKNEDNKRKLTNLLRSVLPFMDDFVIRNLLDMSILPVINETYTPGKSIPASLVSDGTINIIALIVALFFEIKSLTIIEEPERNIHPILIAKVVSLLKEAAEQKQILVSTHNPEMIKHVDIEDLLLISRDADGYSVVSQPKDSEKVKSFMKNEIGVEDLFVQDLLGG